MNQEIQIKKYILPVIILLVIGVSVVVGLTIWRNSQFRLVTSTPSTKGTIPTSTGTFKLTFNQELGSFDMYQDIEGDNKTLVSDVETNGNTLYLYIKTLAPGSVYKFNLRNIKSKSGETITSIPFNVRATYVPFNRLPKEQQDLEVSKTDRDNISDPILNILPYQGEDYYLEAEFSADDEEIPILIINAELFIRKVDLGKENTQIISEFEPRIFAYLRSKNIDPEKYDYRYTINEPPATPSEP
jgi:hypothetical protein